MKKLLTYDLQMFADEESGENEVVDTAESTEVAEESEPEAEETSEEETGVADQPKQSDEENARYAAVRRKAEEDARKKYEAQISQLNERAAVLCNGIVNPLTGQPITNAVEYFDALEKQQQAEMEEKFRSKGIDPEMVNQMIEANPLVRQAKQVIEKAKFDDANIAIQRDLDEISKIDPNIKSMEDIANLENCDEIIARIKAGQTLLDAYKVANFDAILKNQGAKERQQAINQIRGKSHLNTPSGVAQADESVDVPMDILNRWKSEGKTEKEIKAIYNKTLKALHLS